ncbi:MAG: dihydrodipicolinate reductase [Pseudomonadota bacterium]
MTLTRALCAICLISALALPAAAEPARIDTRDQFVQTVEGRNLTLFGIRLVVTPDGVIDGRAFGRDVKGQWQWRDGFFCRDLYWGTRDLGPNCQEVRLNGNKIRFTSDRGTGQYADLTLR